MRKMRKKGYKMKTVILEALENQEIFVKQDYETIIDRFLEACQNNDIPSRWSQKTIIDSILMLEDSDSPEATFSWIIEVRLQTFVEWAINKIDEEREKKAKRAKIADEILADIAAKMLAKKD